MAGSKAPVLQFHYKPNFAKICESEALTVRQCGPRLQEFGLTLWVVSVLVYNQRLLSTDSKKKMTCESGSHSLIKVPCKNKLLLSSLH